MTLRFMRSNWKCPPAYSAALFVSLAITSTTILNGQQVRTLDRNVQCRNCEITVRSLGRITDDGDNVVLGELAFPLMLDENRIAIVGPGMHGFRVLTISTGNVRSIGRRGSGPGEYSSITNILRSPSGSIFILDRSLRRATHVDATFKVVTTLPLQDVRGPTKSVVADNGQFVVSGERSGKESAGKVFHRYDALGRFGNSFSAVSTESGVGNEVRFSRRMMIARDNSFWATSATEFRLEHWTVDGQLVETIHGPGANLHARRTGEWPFGSNRPPDVMLAISQFAPDTAMIVTRVPNNPWPTVPKVVVSNAEGRSTSYPIKRELLDRYFSTRIDLIDLKTARTIASTILPFATWGIGDRELSHSQFSKDNLETLEFLRLHLNQK